MHGHTCQRNGQRIRWFGYDSFSCYFFWGFRLAKVELQASEAVQKLVGYVLSLFHSAIEHTSSHRLPTQAEVCTLRAAFLLPVFVPMPLEPLTEGGGVSPALMRS